VTETDPRGQPAQHPTRQDRWRSRLTMKRRTPVFAAGVLPLAALTALVIGILSARVLPRGVDVSPRPLHQSPTQPAVVIPSHFDPRAQRGTRVQPRTPLPKTMTITSSVPSSSSPRPPEGRPRPTPRPAPHPPKPTPPPAEPAPPPTTPPEPAAPAAPTESASLPSTPPTSEAPQPSQTPEQPTKPGWGCGDGNHQHTGPPGKDDRTPCQP
jgi:hypothetical protein